MLELRPGCEQCNAALPPASTEAMICSFECTFCRRCVDELRNVCPNCGGGFTPRPIRPAHDWRNGNSLERYPAGTRIIHHPVDAATHAALCEAIGQRPPEHR